MGIKKTNKSKWLVDIQPNGRSGKRIRKHFRTKAEAQYFSNWAHEQARQNPDWCMPKSDNRKLSSLIEKWHEEHGKTLIESTNRYNKLKKVCADLNDPIAESITPEAITKLRNFYLESGMKKSSINKYMSHLKSLFNQLIKLKIWTKENPIKDVEPLKTKELDIRYLSTEEIKELLEKLNQSSSQSVLNVAKICLATGARWSEAQNLTRSQIGHDRVTFTKTKNGKTRTIPLDSNFCMKLKNYENEELFTNCYDTFAKYLRQCSFKVRENQASHVLRHTFATHFMANGGNLIALKEILGHSDIKMTMVYAHYLPEHLEQVKALNPLNSLTLL